MSVILAEGTVFARRYRVVRLIAAGAMGAVHEVIHLETERRRALKVMHAHLFQSEEMRERFKREARIGARVESEHIVDVFDAGVDEATGMPFLVMELLRGEELGERVERAGRLPPAEAVTYLYQTALALDRTHAASIVHRDLKPANIFLSQREDGSVRVKILDFGIAKLVAEGSTAAGATSSLGTPIYMPPEQFHGRTRLTGAADIFALGMMAYTLLVGASYWDPEASTVDGVFAFAMIAVGGPQEPPVQRARSMGVTLPPAFDAWFARATAVDPAARFQRATDAVRALGEVLGVPVAGGQATFPSPPSWPGTAPTAAKVAPAAAALSPALVTTEPAPAAAMSAGAERDARSSGPALVGSSTGVAVSGMLSSPSRPSRAPLAAGLSALGLLVLLGGGWLALRASRGGEPAAADVTTAAATPESTAAAPEPTLAPAPASTPEPTLVPAPASAPAAAEPSATAPPPPASTTAPRAPSIAAVRVSAAPTSTTLRPGAPSRAPAAKPSLSGPRPPSSNKKPPALQPTTSTSPYGRY
ncbi:serine/threonine-protein kinase [Sorangium atrum]|uniref:non-specific serine/threonine protein kinase n=1 Tax=Sorangium atrum TaxID=2995308 RepID=A0ABT5BWL5_9BACT|nr:serine/threonine-protein kinase [Sorangium aterium]MDC0677798.1 protein kinase [Sorangium aterium]